MEILCCREANTDRCDVNLGRVYAGNYPSIESFLADSEKRESLIEEPGILYHEDDKEEVIDRWKLSGHEIHKPIQTSRFDAIVILYYQPVAEVD